MVHLNLDVLSEIFAAVVHTGSSSLLTLRLVNNVWYEITERNPRLWTRLLLNRKFHFTNLKYTQLHLQKSRSFPIDIHIAVPNDVALSEIRGVSNLLRNHTSRFRSFKVDAPIRDYVDGFLFLIARRQPAPLLESLELRVPQLAYTITVLTLEFLFTSFTPAPRLARLEIPGLSLVLSGVGIKYYPKYPNMTSLVIDGMSLDYVPIQGIISFLSSIPSLQHFVYKGHGESRTTVRDPYIAYMPNLRSVDVTAPGAGGNVLYHIDAPALTDVRLDGFHNWHGVPEGNPSESLRDIILLLSVHSRNLRRLTLEYTAYLEIPCDFEIIFDGISFPHLEEVYLNATDITDRALRNAKSHSSLRKLELLNCIMLRGSSLLEFAQRRDRDFHLSLRGCRKLKITQQDMDTISELIKFKKLH
ncbi:hypothetical protein M413DRAFT_31820 [Hebeloma cylindrosporum]|uniref:F-box domain-containing protein n=1 Tax=Hebeloma cylindrosporum TaxID=76867 RepID=A0A0C3BXQ8_HEBCY|nr:hypothetical protein M413DRAFT_31820 [Hebeloma cylindrosporum h7]